jgi:hypothetical protein
MNRSIIRNLAVAGLVAYPAFALGADQAPEVPYNRPSHPLVGTLFSQWINKALT